MRIAIIAILAVLGLPVLGAVVGAQITQAGPDTVIHPAWVVVSAGTMPTKLPPAPPGVKVKAGDRVILVSANGVSATNRAAAIYARQVGGKVLASAIESAVPRHTQEAAIGGGLAGLTAGSVVLIGWGVLILHRRLNHPVAGGVGASAAT
jgi:hypothetical protein